MIPNSPDLPSDWIIITLGVLAVLMTGYLLYYMEKRSGI